MSQLDLFATPTKEAARLTRHRRDSVYGTRSNAHGCAVSSWPAAVMEFRHARNTTGWSTASRRFLFALALHETGEMSADELARWERFDRRVRRWDSSVCLFAEAA